MTFRLQPESLPGIQSRGVGFCLPAASSPQRPSGRRRRPACGQPPEAAMLLSSARGQPEGSPLSTHPALQRTPVPPYALIYIQPPVKASGSSQAESVTVPRLPRFHGPSPLWWSLDAAFPCILWARVRGWISSSQNSDAGVLIPSA